MSDIKRDLIERDAIDFKNEKVGKLFKSMLFPTLVGMISIVILNITDGVFVGKGVGSNALAAVNIVAPLFTISSGIGLMFGIGCSIVSSIHLSKGSRKAASINITQALIAVTIIGLIFSAIVLSNLADTCRIFGSSELLIPLASSYMKWIAIFVVPNMIGMTGMFLIRLDGSPKFAMSVNLVAAAMNIFLDWLFIFPFGWGLEGAALATCISFGVAFLLVMYFLFFSAKSFSLYKLKFSMKSFMLTMRNLGYQMKLGSSALLGDLAIALVMVVGNYVFMHYMGEDGVAAFSVCCYCLPVVFMLGNSIVQSSQPIISFAYGVGDTSRIRKAVRLAIITSLVGGALSALMICFGAGAVSGMFLDSSCRAYTLAVEGLPLFSIGFFFICVNLVAIGCYQSIEMAHLASFLTLLRGAIFVVPSFILLPVFLAPWAIWLAVPLAEALTLCVIIMIRCYKKR